MKKSLQNLETGTRAKRLNVSEAKAKFSQALRELEDSPIIVHNRGHDVAVLVSIDDYERLVSAESSAKEPTMGSFIDAVEALKQRFGGGAELLTRPTKFQPVDPFVQKKRR